MSGSERSWQRASTETSLLLLHTRGGAESARVHPSLQAGRPPRSLLSSLAEEEDWKRRKEAAKELGKKSGKRGPGEEEKRTPCTDYVK